MRVALRLTRVDGGGVDGDVNRALAGSPSAPITVPVTPAKRPFTVEIMRWRTANSTPVCAGSMVQTVCAVGCTDAGDAMVAMSRNLLCVSPRQARL